MGGGRSRRDSPPPTSGECIDAMKILRRRDKVAAVDGDPPALSPVAGTPDSTEPDGPRLRRIDFRLLLTRDFLRYLGPSFVVTIGFIDPGNWATNVAGGSSFGYRLIWLITLSTLMLVLFQSMSARLGDRHRTQPRLQRQAAFQAGVDGAVRQHDRYRLHRYRRRGVARRRLGLPPSVRYSRRGRRLDNRRP